LTACTDTIDILDLVKFVLLLGLIQIEAFLCWSGPLIVRFVTPHGGMRGGGGGGGGERGGAGG
jgi:hypothetical protein